MKKIAVAAGMSGDNARYPANCDHPRLRRRLEMQRPLSSSLMDLLNETNVSPALDKNNITRLEKEYAFINLIRYHPYDLAEYE